VAAVFQTIRRQTLKPVPRRNLIEWADTFRRLSSRAAAQPGRWRTSRSPMALGPTRAVTDPKVRTVTVMAPTQEFKSELLLNAAGYFSHQDPSPILFIQPTDKLAESFSKDRLQPMLEVTPVLAEISPDPKSRSSDSTLTRKAFDTGSVIDLVGANSPTDLASRPKRVILADEVDKYPPTAGKEGDPLSLAEERQSSFWNAKSIRTCSPTRKGFSRIGREYAMSDQRRLFVRCPHCGDAQVMTFDRVRWDKDENHQHLPETAGYCCRGCGVVWSEAERRAAVQAVQHESDLGYRQTRPFRCCNADHKPLDWSGDEHWTPTGEALCPTCNRTPIPCEHQGFNPSKLYSLTQSLAATVKKFLNQKDDVLTLQVFTNTQLAEEWEEGGVSVSQDSLLARREPYGEDDFPKGVLWLTAAVDVQDNRLELDVVGWGAGAESWGIKHTVLMGDPAMDPVWHSLDELLLRAYHRADGRAMRIQTTLIDSGGHHTQRVYGFCAERLGRRVYAIKGDGGAGKPIWPKRVSISRTKHTLFMVGTNAASDQVYSALRVKKPGAGYCHFSADYDAAYFSQLLAEKVIRRRVGGQDVRAYECPKGVRNEAHDLRRYNVAALYASPIQLPKAAAVPTADAGADDSGPHAAADGTPASTSEQAKPSPPLGPPQRKRRRKKRRGLNDSGDSWL